MKIFESYIMYHIRRRNVALTLLSLAMLLPMGASAQSNEKDEYDMNKSNVTVIGSSRSGERREVRLTSLAPFEDRTCTANYQFVIEGANLEMYTLKQDAYKHGRVVMDGQYIIEGNPWVRLRGKVKMGDSVRFFLTKAGETGDNANSSYCMTLGYRIASSSGNGYTWNITSQRKGDTSQSLVVDTVITISKELVCGSTSNNLGKAFFRLHVFGDELKPEIERIEDTNDTNHQLRWATTPKMEILVSLFVEPGEEIAKPTEEPVKETISADTITVAHVVEDGDAWNFDGAWPFAIPASVIAAIAGYGLIRRKKGNGAEEEQPKQSDCCEMVIYKKFGNTLTVGDMPQQVYAKIVRKTPHGNLDDPALTAMIQITSGDGYLMVAEGGMQGNWRTAWVGAPETDNVPPEGVVSFRMGNAQGSYTNRLHFLIEAGEVIFGQPNLTLPAHYKKEARLPFVVTGIEQGSPVKVTITDHSGRVTANYSVETEWNAKEGLYYAIIRDRVLDKEKDKGVPGKYLTYKINVEAMSHCGKPVMGGLYLYRYYMGLVLEIFGGNDVKCFIEEYDVTKHQTKKFAAESGGRLYVPAETKCKLTLFDYDETEHRIMQLAPVPKTFTIKAKDDSQQYLVDKVFVQIDLNSRRPGEGTYGVLRCTKAVLDAPNRVAGVVMCSVMQGEKEVTLEQDVRLCSQPRRDINDNFAMDAELKNDNRITDQLFHIRSEIYRHQLVNNLFPLVKYIDMVIDGYDPDFGYDKKTLRTIVHTYNDVFTGAKAGANAEPPRPLTLADDMLLFIKTWYETAKTTSQNLGLCGRLFVGFATLGCSELVFATVDTISIGEEIITNMKDYVDKGGDSIWGGFYVGAKVAAREYIMSKVMEGGMKAIGATARAAGLTPDKMKEALGSLNNQLKKPFSTSTKGASIKAAGQRNTISRANSQARVKAKVEAAGITGQSGKPGISGTSGRPEIPGKPGKPALPDGAKKPALPDGAKKPALPDGAKKPALPDGAKKPALPDGTKKPALPDNTGKPALPDNTGKPGTSGKPGQPATTGTSAKPANTSIGNTNLNDATSLGKARAKQNVNDLRAACEMYRANPTPENLKLRNDMIMKCQADKQTMYLLKEKGDAFTSTRRDFNGHLDDIYKKTDAQVKAELSARLGGKEVRTKNMSSKTRTDLQEGKTVTMDRDSTYQYLDDDGVWKTIDDKTFGEGTEKMVEQTYNRHFHEQATGIKPKTEPGVDLKPLEQKLADNYGKKMDQTIIQNELTHRESYGKDVDMMLDKSRHSERMQDARQVGKAVENKGVERFEDARKMLNEAENMTDPTAKVNKQADAIGEVREGCRQEVKIMDQFTDSMDLARSDANEGSKISDKLRDGIEIMRMCEEGTLPVDQAEANLRNIGYDSFDAVCRDHAATITAIGS